MTAMSVQITIRRVPTAVRNRLAARAAQNGQSMQAYLLQELESLASKPTVNEWLAQVQARKQLAGTRVSASEILTAVHADRK